MREFTNHDFLIVERVREDESKRFFVYWDGYDDVVHFTQNVMDCTKLTKKGSMDYILMLDKLYPDEKFAFRKLEVDFDIKKDFVW